MKHFPYEKQLIDCHKKSVSISETIWLENIDGHFEKREFPKEAQVAPVNTIIVMDVNADGNLDIILAGNKTKARVKLGKLDGNHGLVLKGDGHGNFTPMPYANSNLNLKDDIRTSELININKKKAIIFGVNDGMAKTYTTNDRKRTNKWF